MPSSEPFIEVVGSELLHGVCDLGDEVVLVGEGSGFESGGISGVHGSGRWRNRGVAMVAVGASVATVTAAVMVAASR